MLALATLLTACSGATAPTTATATPTPSPTPAPNATVYVGAGPTVEALDARTGAERWTSGTLVSEATPSGVRLLTVTGSELLFEDDGASALYALSTVDGTLLWKVTIQPGAQDLFVGDGIAILSGGIQVYGRSIAIDLQTGKVLWRQAVSTVAFIAGSGVIYREVTVEVPSSSGPPSYDQNIQAINPSTGATLWQVAGEFGELALVGNLLYSANGDVVAIDTQHGTLAWSLLVNGGVAWIIQHGTTLYFGNGPSPSALEVYALNGTTHTVLWQTPLPTGSSCAQAPESSYCGGGAVYANNTLCATYSQTGTDTLYGFDTTSGTSLWHQGNQAGYYATLTDNGLCFAESANSQVDNAPLTAVNLRTGTTQWTANVPEPDGAAFAEGGLVYLISLAVQSGGNPNAVLLALSEANGAVLWHFDTGSTERGSVVMG